MISIYAANDGLAGPEEVLSAQPRLPSETQFIELPGGNHAGFGWYGIQQGDGEKEKKPCARAGWNMPSSALAGLKTRQVGPGSWSSARMIIYSG